MLYGNTPAYAGKTASLATGKNFAQETPPLTRGKHLLRSEKPEPAGNTPAYAGKTDPEPMSSTGIGETPPLTRGKRSRSRGDGMRIRNTPAYAGKTAVRISCSSKSWKHPRLRGENLIGFGRMRNLLETPPLTRGKHRKTSIANDDAGNTPAYAGKTRLAPLLSLDVQKHPRLRGENRTDRRSRQLELETPPLARGKQCFRR